MERLTNHFDYCDFTECRHYDKELAKKDNCNFIHSSRNQCLEYAVYNKLREYEDLEEQILKSVGTDLASMVGEFMHYYNLKKENRLLELPCKVGERYYYIDDGDVYKFRTDNIEIREEDGEFVYCMDGMDLRNSDFGKVAFLTEKEAVEKALAEMEKENE